MTDYSTKSYGRNAEIERIFALLKAGKDVSKHGPRRLGKTFVLDRMVEQAKSHGFLCVKVEIAGCTEPKMVFRRLCEEITNFELGPLSEDEAVDYLRDLPQLGLLHGRKEITDHEARAIIEAVGWRAAFYLEALALNLPPNPETDPQKVQANIVAAMGNLLKSHNLATFGTWEEHLHKHHSDQQRRLSFGILNTLAPHDMGMTLDNILGALADSRLNRELLRQHLILLIAEGFLYQEPFGEDAAPYRFRLAPLRRWWVLYHPQATA